jgi:disulfide bond formation protein DsbB
MTNTQQLRLARLANLIALVALIGVLSGSLNLQFGTGEPPCPLCLVQRSGMIGLAVGPLLNLMWGMKARNYALSILAASAGIAGSIRQVLLHVATPGDPGYGPADMGLHLYTWAAITFAIAIIGIAILLLWSTPLNMGDTGVMGEAGAMRIATVSAAAVISIYLILMTIFILPICGLGECPADPPLTSNIGDIGAWLALAGVWVVSIAIGFIVNRRLTQRASR